jgi:hypothetical protein
MILSPNLKRNKYENNMKELFIPYEQALALKELGFDEECLGYYFYNGSLNKWSLIIDNEQCEYLKTISAPLYQQIFRWFREKYNLDSWVYRPDEKLNIWGYNTTLHTNVSPFKSYEEAELECLKILIQIAKKRNK